MLIDLPQYVFYAIGVLIALGVFCAAGFRLVRHFFRKGRRLPEAFQKIVLQVRVAKELAHADEKKEFSKEKIHELISQTEEFFSSIGGLRAPKGFNAWLYGRQDHVSFEIVVQKGKINFFIAVPIYLRRYLEEQVHAQFPRAEITEIDDYNIFFPHGETVGGRLKLMKEYIFPLKNYRQFDSDPLDSIFNTLSKVREDEGVAIQYIVRTARPRWHAWGAKVAQEMNQGKKVKEALKKAGQGFGSKLGSFFVTAAQEAVKNSTDDLSQKPKDPYHLSPMEQEIVKNLENKSSKAGLEVNVNLIVSTSESGRGRAILDNIANAFSQYNIYEYGNGFQVYVYKNVSTMAVDFIYRNFRDGSSYILNTEELASVFHFPLPITETPNINWLGSRSAPAPVDLPGEGIILGTNVYRGQERFVRISKEDRMRHTYVIGQTGTGKSLAQAYYALQDIENGSGVAVVDPHGSLVEEYIMPRIPKARLSDVIYFDPSDVERPIGLNMLEADTPHEMDFVTQEMIAIFYKLVTDPAMIGPMFEHNMRNAMFTLMADKEHPGTMTEIPRMFTDTNFQEYKLTFVTDPLVRQFWEKEMAQTTENTKSEMLGYLISKVGRFVENSMMRNIIGQPKSGFNIREIMDGQKILLVNLSKGKMGDINSNLLGLILVSKILQAALSRVDMPEQGRKDFYLYIDEFQNFITDSIATILAEARKYRLGLTIAHQYINQLVSGTNVEQKEGNSKVRDAVFGNVGTILAFRIGVDDSEFMQKQFAPVFSAHDLINIQNLNAYLRLLIHGHPAKPFNIVIPKLYENALFEYHPEYVQLLKEHSRLAYGRPREEVEKEIMERSKLGAGEEEDDDLGDFNLMDDDAKNL